MDRKRYQGSRAGLLPQPGPRIMIRGRLGKSGAWSSGGVGAPPGSLPGLAPRKAPVPRSPGPLCAPRPKASQGARPALRVIAALRPPCRADDYIKAPLRFALYFGWPGTRVARPKTGVVRPGCGRLPPNRAAKQNNSIRSGASLPLKGTKPLFACNQICFCFVFPVPRPAIAVGGRVVASKLDGRTTPFLSLWPAISSQKKRNNS